MAILTCRQLQYDARATLDALNEDFTAQDTFEEAFLKNHRYLQTRFDVVLRFVFYHFVAVTLQLMSY